MKSLLLLLALGLSALAQIPTPQPTKPLAPELAPLAAKHQADLATIEIQRAAALAPYPPAYFARLDAEEKTSLNRADIEAVAAIRKERGAVKAGGFGDLIASPPGRKRAGKFMRPIFQTAFARYHVSAAVNAVASSGSHIMRHPG